MPTVRLLASGVEEAPLLFDLRMLDTPFEQQRPIDRRVEQLRTHIGRANASPERDIENYHLAASSLLVLTIASIAYHSQTGWTVGGALLTTTFLGISCRTMIAAQRLLRPLLSTREIFEIARGQALAEQQLARGRVRTLAQRPSRQI